MATRTIPTSDAQGEVTGQEMAARMQDELSGLWRRAVCPLTVTGGDESAIEAACDPPHVEGEGEGMAFWLTPLQDNAGAATLAIDGGEARPVTGIDGAPLAAGALRAGRICLLAADGEALRLMAQPSASEIRIFDTPGDHIWRRPPGVGDDALVSVELIGGGGGGSSSGGAGGGGGGGLRARFRAGDLPDTVTVTVAAPADPQQSGNSSSFGSFAFAHGGGRGGASDDWRATPARGGAGGGALRPGADGDGDEADGTGGGDTTAGGLPGAFSGLALHGYFGGGSGAPSAAGAGGGDIDGGDSVFGGGGGGSDGIGGGIGQGGNSLFAGGGGTARHHGAAPGGGGGGSLNLNGGQPGGRGARGEVRVRVTP